MCDCRPRLVMVTDYRCNYSAFNGYHFAPSDYSRVWCLRCGGTWRTKAAYVEDAYNAPKGWEQVGSPAKWRAMIGIVLPEEQAARKRAKLLGKGKRVKQR